MNHRRRYPLLLTLFISVVSLTSCGQSGPLYLPKPPKSLPKPVTTNQQATTNTTSNSSSSHSATPMTSSS